MFERYRHRLATCLLALAPSVGITGESAVIFMYHHVDDSTPASTSVSPALFERQLDYLEREGFSVRPLLELIEALEAGQPVPDGSVAITFDDGYSSVLEHALPALQKRDWPFTVFVNTEPVDNGFGGYLSWDELRELGRAGATIGNHSATHAHLVRKDAGESDSEWRARIGDEIDTAAGRLAAEVGAYTIPVFAYPYGEYAVALEQIVADHKLYGVGQQSGPFGRGSDFLALPRFPLAAELDSLDEFGLRARTRPLPVRVVGEERHIVEPELARPALHLALAANARDVRADALSCYASRQGRMAIEWGEPGAAFIATPNEPLSAGRTKYNCTAPSLSASGVYYWYGYLWMKKERDGDWYAE
ncbi:MAG: polysaccharide deacetylase family protein [Gammaproteobacteria bacterium]